MEWGCMICAAGTGLVFKILELSSWHCQQCVMVRENFRAFFFFPQCLKCQGNIYWHFQKQQGIGFHGAFQHSHGDDLHNSAPWRIAFLKSLRYWGHNVQNKRHPTQFSCTISEFPSWGRSYWKYFCCSKLIWQVKTIFIIFLLLTLSDC